MERILKFLVGVLWWVVCTVEVIVSTATHVLYASCIVSSALVADFMKWWSKSKKGWIGLRRVSSFMRKESSIASAPLESFSADVPPAFGEVIRSNNENKSRQVSHGRTHSPHFAPIILLHGIFGFGQGRLGGLSYFGGAELKDERILVPDLGSLSSLHDRACELFYFLKGGVVDYGEEHSRKYGHNRYGKIYNKGHFPEWDEKHPVHFVGHSSGVQVARLLQTMLAEKHFSGFPNSNENWVASITSISGALNGTTRVYLDGLHPSDGKSMQIISLLQVLRIGVMFLEWLDIPYVKRFYSWGFDHFDLSWKKVGVSGLFKGLFGQLGPFHSGDWILPDLSIQACSELNLQLKTFPKTYYFSYATKKTQKFRGRTVPSAFGIHPLFFLRSWQMSLWKHPKNYPPPYPGYKDEDWQENDGALNTISMLFPMVPVVHPHSPLRDQSGERQEYKPGVWYYTILDADHITFILDPSRAGVHFEVLYNTIFERCRSHLSQEGRKMEMSDFRCENCLHVCICRSPNTSVYGA